MSHPVSHVEAANSNKPFDFHSVTIISAVVAAATTFVTLTAALPAWAMFLGWVGYSTSGQTIREGISNLVSFLLGVVFGVGTALLIDCLTPWLGAAATPVAIFGDVVVVLSLRAVPHINNPLAYFLGLISFFASMLAPSASTLGILAIAGVLGALGAGTAGYLQARVVRAREAV
ncbi:DUF1097 domain-containing protein [Pendulispora brunnea]|uniref:DUF1097 domain-containing protein n=1 Tax=Pendulispora brunnea TaxID=2905690 RepID=A0ABZ2K6W6_9BACT